MLTVETAVSILATSLVQAHDAAAPAVAGDLAVPAPQLSWAGWILGLPAIASALCWLFAAMRIRSKLPAFVTVLALGASFVLTLSLYRSYEHPVTIHLFDWIHIAWGPGPHQSLVASWALYVDGLTLFWMLFVTGLGTLIALYASEYMESDVGGDYGRFFASVSVFLLAMGCLVMGGNLVLLYLGWEGVGLASYLLIGYYYGKPTAVAAAKKAFVMNRVGDLGLLIGIYLIWRNFGSLDYVTIFRSALGGVAEGGDWTKALIPYFLMLGAFGKSAQIPLYTWLPDAMEGPTPVSALIHAATMVTAGVYLIARTYPLFQLEPHALTIVAWIGGLTALLAATIGMMQYDMKRVFAYSTISQLGYMFLGLGVGTTFGAAYHVFTHAFFKALLFLTAGAVMHGFAGQLDIRKISGLRLIPGFKIVAWTMLVGCLWLSAFPFSAGFFSKDEILATAMLDHVHGSQTLAWIGLITAGLTSYYTFRVWFRVCGGPASYVPGEEATGHDAGGAGHAHGHGPDAGHAPAASTAHAGGFHPHAPRLAINGVLLVIAIGAFLSGMPSYLNKFAGKEQWVETMIGDSTAAVGVPNLSAHGAEHAAHATFLGMDGHLGMGIVSAIIGLSGLGIALWFHLLNRKAADSLKQTLLASGATRWLPKALENKWYVDEIYDGLFRTPIWVLANVLAFLDRMVVDGGLVGGIGRLPAFIARLFQPLYNGLLQGYAVMMAGGLGLILAWWIVWAWMKGGL